MIENIPITRLSSTYQCRLLEKLKERFTEKDQQMFLTSVYGYLNYNSRTDYVIDFDTVWEWCGFSQKISAKKVLEKNFIKDKDYKCLLYQSEEQRKIKGRGGKNKEIIMLTINAFKLFCMKAGTKKAEEIHEYYVKLEETLHEVINEECSQLREEIIEKTKIENNECEKKRLREKTILDQFPSNVQCVYYGIIENKSDKNESLIKFGHSNYLRERVEKHKKTFQEFYLINAYKVENKLQIENAIKTDSHLRTLRRTITINDISQTELLSIEEDSLDEIDNKIRKIIESIEFNPENYNKILDENKKIKREYTLLLDKYNVLLKKKGEPTEEPISKVVIIRMKKYNRQKDGYYHIHGINYEKLNGSRNEVWQNIAYRTSGGLIKEDLLENHSGKIISKNKHIDSSANNHLAAYNAR